MASEKPVRSCWHRSEHNEEQVAQRVVERLRQGEGVAYAERRRAPPV